MCSTRLCLCLDFFRQIGHSNFGSTPHSKRICRFKLCGLAYELPHCLHIKILLLDAVVAVVVAAVIGGLRGDVRSICVSRSVFRSNRFGGDFVVITGSDNSFKHVAGVSKRKSHGWSYPMTAKIQRKREKKKQRKKKHSRITFENNKNKKKNKRNSFAFFSVFFVCVCGWVGYEFVFESGGVWDGKLQLKSQSNIQIIRYIQIE